MYYVTSGDMPVNKGLLDARNTGRIFADLADRFYPVEFFDLCTIIEQIVLRDEIILVGKFDRLHRSYKDALKPFIDAGVFRVCIDAFLIDKTVAIDSELQNLARRAQFAKLTSTSLTDADYAVTRLLGAEITLRIPTVPLLQHLHNYQFFRRPILDNTVCDLVARCADVSERIQKAKASDFRRLGLKPIPIPPIALYVLQRAHSYEKLREQILQARDDFRRLRQTMTELAATLSDPAMSSAKYYQLVGAWEQKWRKVADVGVPSIVQIGTSAAPLLAGGKELAVAYKAGATVGTVLAGLKLVTLAGPYLGGLTLRPVHLSVNNYLRTHPREMLAAVARVFEIDPGFARRQMEAIGGPTSNVWRAALQRLGHN